MKGRRLASKLPNTMRRDPGATGSVSFGFVDLPERGQPPLIRPEIEFHPGRRGAAERDLMIEKGESIHISLTGWFTDKVSLTHAQAAVVRDALIRMLGDEPSVVCLRCNHILSDAVISADLNEVACPNCTANMD
jgi:hypothetical protein